MDRANLGLVVCTPNVSWYRSFYWTEEKTSFTCWAHVTIPLPSHLRIPLNYFVVLQIAVSLDNSPVDLLAFEILLKETSKVFYIVESEPGKGSVFNVVLPKAMNWEEGPK